MIKYAKAAALSALLLSATALTTIVPGSAQAQTLVIAAPAVPEGFDGDALRPGTQSVVTQVYENLMRYGRTERDGRPYLDASVIEPHLAESYAVSDDGLTYTIKLREGVMSPYGNELTADDVEWSWNKSFDQKRTGNFIARVANVESVNAKSKYEVEFHLGAPSSIFLSALTLYVPGIYDSTEVKSHATEDDPWALEWLASNTAGFGAYHLQQVRPDEAAMFTVNPNYFGEKPYFERVMYREVPSAASRATLLLSGQAQWIDRPSIQQVVDLRDDPRVKVEDSPGRAMLAARMNPTFKPFDDVKVRQALNYAIDREELMASVLRGTGDTGDSLVPPIVDGYDPSFFDYTHDPEKAKAMLAEAGYPDGFEVELLYSDLWWWLEPLSIQLASQLADVGVTVKPIRITGSDMRSRGSPGTSDMPFFVFEDGPIVLDPVYTFYLLAHSDGVSNRMKYSNPELDALIDEARQTLDRDKRLALMTQAQELWMAEAPWLTVAYPRVFEAMSPNIVGWTPYPDDHERWADLSIEE
ncbi:ABC transporter substrate-binding protein [Acuticoccus sp. MNP-M23]|uniref:ABC transporter substrate-binding protein n=1 Tax=Acuticoccus sp. MNP-M23 TaxID=3072793 RepID=UPI0028154A08|nr:ABC transporter substrate-binding protein [Acuticoccus sp. MNP-M23]WMS42571.1 ABC transporter substrate-binding protein [Acuticoccus sp. MNP-M23]